MDDPRITFLNELVALLKSTYGLTNLYVLRGTPGIWLQTILSPTGGDGNQFNVREKSNFRFVATHFAETELDVLNLAWNFRHNILISPESVNFKTAFTWKLHDLEAMDEPGPAFENEVWGGYWTTSNYFCKIRN